MTSLDVPRADGTWERVVLRGPRDWPGITTPFTTRVASSSRFSTSFERLISVAFAFCKI